MRWRGKPPVRARRKSSLYLTSRVQRVTSWRGGLIRPGYTVTARVDVNRIEDVLLIPLEAISEDEGERYVYKVNQSEEGQGAAQRVTLDVLDSNATVAAAQSDNLSAGDLIALTNLEDIQDDAAVQYDPLEEAP